MQLTTDIAARFAAITLDHLERPWPFKLDHVMAGPQDVRAPADLHPIFHGSYDWHSCVHGWWQVLRLMRRAPGMPQAGEIAARANRMLTADKVAGELAYLHRPTSAGFERPYGWGWLLALHDEAVRHDASWGAALAPLAQAFAARFHAYLGKLTYPIRTGAHPNTAFALILARRWAVSRDAALVALIDARARHWFGGDRDAQAWEPDGDAFLSPVLCEALLMLEVLGRDAFADWFDGFLPRATAGEPATLFTPATVSDRDDGKIAHLDGLNFARAWCWREIAMALGPAHPAHQPALATAAAHIAASIDHLADSYMGSHWLASFALLALEAGAYVD